MTGLVLGCDGERAVPRPLEPRPSQPAEVAAVSGTYLSSYFVFLSDEGSPLALPVDVNWTGDGSRVSTELKAWVGTAERWVMRYEEGTFAARGDLDDWWEVPTRDGSPFRFAASGARIEIDVSGTPVWMAVPRFADSGLLRESFAGGTIRTRVDRGRVSVGGEERTGFLLQERVELPARTGDDSSPLFTRFQYFPLVGCDGFYLIKDEGNGRRLAARFRPSAAAVEELGDLALEELRHGRDTTSGRDDIPEAWRIRLPGWSRSFELQSRAHHTGHSSADRRPRPVFRQATVVGRDDQGCAVHGMAELVLER